MVVPIPGTDLASGAVLQTQPRVKAVAHDNFCPRQNSVEVRAEVFVPAVDGQQFLIGLRLEEGSVAVEAGGGDGRDQRGNVGSVRHVVGLPVFVILALLLVLLEP